MAAGPPMKCAARSCSPVERCVVGYAMDEGLWPSYRPRLPYRKGVLRPLVLGGRRAVVSGALPRSRLGLAVGRPVRRRTFVIGVEQVLIVGGGLAGLSLAIALRRRGIGSEIVERAVEWPAEGNVYLPANGFRALRSLGLEEAVASKAFVIARQRFLDHRGRLLMDVDLGEVWDGVGPCLAMPRADLHRVLLAGASGVPLRLGRTVRSVTQDARVATVVFDDGSGGEYDLVVGADGIRSSVRRLVFGGGPPRLVGQASWRCVVEGFPGITSWTVMLARGRSFLAIPLGGGRLYCYCDVASNASEDPTGGDPARLRGLFGDFSEPVPEILRRIEASGQSYFSPIEEVVPDTWVDGRVILTGDAAHAMSPNMAEGVSMALEDALVLAETAASGGSPDQCLQEFQQRRIPRVRWVRSRTRSRDRTRKLPPTIRNLVLRVAGQQTFRSDYRPLMRDP